MSRATGTIRRAGLLAATAMTLAGCGQGSQAPAEQVGGTSGGEIEAMAAPVSVAAVRPETRDFRDWHVVCDNGNGCVAFTGVDTGGWLRIGMEAGPDAQPTVSLGASPFVERDGSGLTMQIDGRPVRLTQGPDQTEFADIAPDRVRSAVADLAKARAVTVAGGGQEAALSPAGVSAALLWIDEKQGRLDTTTALIRRGSRPASAVPAAPALPRVAAAAAVDQGEIAGAGNPGEEGGDAGVRLPAAVEALAEVRACREDTSYNAFLQKAVLAGRLSGDTELWGVPCGSGAYNASYDLYVTGPGGANPRKAEFPSWDARPREEGDIAGDGLVGPVFDARTNTISHFPKARGIGDCGTTQSWAWTGRAFVQTREASMGECWGMPPDLWPTTWRTR